tara:strand:- start:533 stop:913 length:381 start_codon:yes stop_codon:yes gene_type:complete
MPKVSDFSAPNIAVSYSPLTPVPCKLITRLVRQHHHRLIAKAQVVLRTNQPRPYPEESSWKTEREANQAASSTPILRICKLDRTQIFSSQDIAYFKIKHIIRFTSSLDAGLLGQSEKAKGKSVQTR